MKHKLGRHEINCLVGNLERAELIDRPDVVVICDLFKEFVEHAAPTVRQRIRIWCIGSVITKSFKFDSRKVTCPSATSPPHNPIMNVLGSKPGIRDEKPATIHVMFKLLSLGWCVRMQSGQNWLRTVWRWVLDKTTMKQWIPQKEGECLLKFLDYRLLFHGNDYVVNNSAAPKGLQGSGGRHLRILDHDTRWRRAGAKNGLNPVKEHLVVRG